LDHLLIRLPSRWLQNQIDGEYADRVLSQVGTLGGGNHFIEVLHDEDDTIWAMLHSGSRLLTSIQQNITIT
jgi:tRNA-splicing ligase RtcB